MRTIFSSEQITKLEQNPCVFGSLKGQLITHMNSKNVHSNCMQKELDEEIKKNLEGLGFKM